MRTSDSSRTVIPFERWPDVDRLAWQAAVRPGDPFEDVGPEVADLAAAYRGNEVVQMSLVRAETARVAGLAGRLR